MTLIVIMRSIIIFFLNHITFLAFYKIIGILFLKGTFMKNILENVILTKRFKWEIHQNMAQYSNI